MGNPLTSTLAKLFRDRARSTSLKQLRQEGHRSVRVLDLSNLEELLTHALEHAVAETSVDASTAATLAQEAGSELSRLLGTKEGLERETRQLQRQQRALADNVELVQTALQSTRQELDQALQGDGASESPRQRLEAAWAPAYEQAGQRWANDEGARQAIEELYQALQDATAPLLSRSASNAADGDVELLQRRVGKLQHSLDEAHALMHRLREQRDEEETGVASVHETVQGLKGNEDHLEQRQSLLHEVFKLNLELRGDLAAESKAG